MDLLVTNIEKEIVDALRKRAAANGRTVEAEHMAILEQALCYPPRKSLAEALLEIPNVGRDSDFERRQE